MTASPAAFTSCSHPRESLCSAPSTSSEPSPPKHDQVASLLRACFSQPVDPTALSEIAPPPGSGVMRVSACSCM
ncbi:MAG: hypothetical protein Q8R60_16650 [Mycobacteriales bacterium]|nr:hypothetical protein [Mycobacteriales bacterium]